MHRILAALTSDALAVLAGVTVFVLGCGLTVLGVILLFMESGWSFRTDVPTVVGMLISSGLSTLAAARLAHARWPAWVVGIMSFGLSVFIALD